MRALRFKIIAACLVAALAPQPARADVANFDPDLRCAAIGFAAVGGATEQQRSSGMLVAAYYVGKLQGRNPAINLEEELYQLSQRMTQADIAAEAARCGQEFEALGRSMIEMGNNLQRRAREAPGAN
jgi:hypothetical protein